MNYQRKNAIYFLISIVVLTYTFYCFTSSIIVGLIISCFVSLFLFYDPKRIRSTKETDSSKESNTEN